jgi:hypothetical protein
VTWRINTAPPGKTGLMASPPVILIPTGSISLLLHVIAAVISARVAAARE